MCIIEPDKLRLTPPVKGRTPVGKKRRLPKHKRGEEFLKGPIPLTWLQEAARLPGKTIVVGLVIWFKVGCNKTATVKTSNLLLHRLGVGRKAGYEGLRRLEKAGLIEVERHIGRSPVVTVQV